MLLATRLNRAMKQEQVEWQSLCRGFGVFGIVIVACNVLAMFADGKTAWVLGFKIWCSLFMFATFVKSYQIECNRYMIGNKFKHILIFDYLCRLSDAKEISDEVAEKFDRMTPQEREEINKKLNVQLLLSYVIVATIFLSF
ncbi:hypothetical protein Aeh1ORF325c [Aeromonas phage Aeh1]|uniref:Uncharacterized protein n=1 Tax=Aeromonas phage Aeh1 TaxID=2880362 RepID=Q76YA0_9CAUD|nr:hypothetical protein Aeh1p345 [Aeromonas phage Aeh1]AAQ17995.1 hypothetical protein Aeh1ORF325c [Aeromonas phage Aeh1]